MLHEVYNVAGYFELLLTTITSAARKSLKMGHRLVSTNAKTLFKLVNRWFSGRLLLQTIKFEIQILQEKKQVEKIGSQCVLVVL